jgi:hypothetical protein
MQRSLMSVKVSAEHLPGSTFSQGCVAAQLNLLSPFGTFGGLCAIGTSYSGVFGIHGENFSVD